MKVSEAVHLADVAFTSGGCQIEPSPTSFQLSVVAKCAARPNAVLVEWQLTAPATEHTLTRRALYPLRPFRVSAGQSIELEVASCTEGWMFHVGHGDGASSEAGVTPALPVWHFEMVADQLRNNAYDQALQVQP